MAKFCMHCGLEIEEEIGSIEIRTFQKNGKICTYYCNDVCYLAELKPVEVNCSICDKKFLAPEWTTETGEPQICSRKCAYGLGY